MVRFYALMSLLALPAAALSLGSFPCLIVKSLLYNGHGKKGGDKAAALQRVRLIAVVDTELDSIEDD